MQELKDRIVKEGKILPGNIVKVDGFLNHRVDCAFMGRIADEFKKYFDLNNVDLILTAEASGMAWDRTCMRNRRYLTTERPAEVRVWQRAWYSPSNR